MRIGNGMDVHRFSQGRKLILGGVEIPYVLGLLGHSDADVLTHAVMDALLGAAGLRDIGYYYPDTDEQYRGADSIQLLQDVHIKLKQRGYHIENIDAVIAAQQPKLSPYIETIQASLASALALDPSRVGVKATTTEGLGFCGRSEGMAAYAVCLLQEDQ